MLLGGGEGKRSRHMSSSTEGSIGGVKRPERPMMNLGKKEGSG